MQNQSLNQLLSAINDIPRTKRDGSVRSTSAGIASVVGLSKIAHIGDLVAFHHKKGKSTFGEVVALSENSIDVLPETGVDGLALNGRVSHLGTNRLMPDKSWLGRVIDPFLRPLDGKPLINGLDEVHLKRSPPSPATRKRLGPRIPTGIAAIDTLLPLVQGQRIGLFAGSGVGKSTLISDLAKGISADAIVISLIGERGREVREFIEETLGSEGLERSVVVAATADQSAMIRRRGAWVGMAIAEYFRDQGAQTLLLTDSVTRFAEAHREIALSSGESTSLQGFPPSTAQELMALSERAGPGSEGRGDITAVFSVLVQGSDMEGPIADIMRGILDGHVILARNIAQRGRYPAIDITKSISRSLPNAALDAELDLIAQARLAISTYEEAQALIKSGLYEAGTDKAIDHAIDVRPHLETFLSNRNSRSISSAFTLLQNALNIDKSS
ncbi:MAG: FliI/YscN family ATPase [Litoreibacter sp.]|uniref:FliI/YscN family ATPase n=1 Tax=Litoreibacter sp. TaxID=1969459 RepID=UPI0032998BBF